MRHNDRIVLEAFAEAVIRLHLALPQQCRKHKQCAEWEIEEAYAAARAAVKAARMLTVKDEYR